MAGVLSVEQSTTGKAFILTKWAGSDSPAMSRAAQQKFGKTPLLVDDEMEAQYKRVYKRAMQGKDSSAQINLVSTHASLMTYPHASAWRACTSSAAFLAGVARPCCGATPLAKGPPPQSTQLERSTSRWSVAWVNAAPPNASH